jgi:hypothetical protein
MRDLAHVWRNLSSLQFSTEQNQKALLSCRNSLIAYRRLLTLDPGRERWITDMRRSTERFQDWLVAAGMTEAALELIRETTSFAERNRSSTPGADVWDDLLARLYADQGQLAKGQGSGADLEAWLNSLKRRTALLDADPESTTALYQWALACLQLGRSYRLSGLASPARVCLRLGNLSLKEMIPAGHAQRDLYLDLLDRELFLTYRDLGVVPESSALVKAGAAWRYWDRRTPPANDWIALDHSEADWAQGSAPFGYGEPDLGTVISFGDDPSNKPLTAWFRHTFEVTDPGAIKTLKVSLRRDDGAMVYLNGQELFRDGLPDGIIEPSATARMVQGLEEEVYHVRLLGKDRFMLHAGHNVLAVEVHQNESQSSDLIMDLEMVANPRNHLEDSALTVQEVEEVLRDALPVLISKRL